MKRVLLINDCKFEKIVIKDLLIKLGYGVELGDEYEALKMSEELDPDIVIVNLIMKETTGDKLIKKIKSINKDIVCILSSSNKLNIDEYKKKGVDGVIQTPINPDKLVEILQCKQTDDKKLRFCPYCGNKLEGLSGKIIFCPFCGQHL
ncbi:response regulator [Clostridium brassicae]|uniref:Stage 0 sporulation protein A homolog n=1 Tax=Clostridium brassicae TaxID=2999072 RepID=A0ABT4D4N3_9CLOT|nr:response regulator [Clostridium brassicae]MCY6957249.1 response regulator [Clostridium brassicae]